MPHFPRLFLELYPLQYLPLHPLFCHQNTGKNVKTVVRFSIILQYIYSSPVGTQKPDFVHKKSRNNTGIEIFYLLFFSFLSYVVDCIIIIIIIFFLIDLILETSKTTQNWHKSDTGLTLQLSCPSVFSRA